MTDAYIEAWVLNKMKRHLYIGGKHTDINNIKKSAPQKFYSQIDDTVKELVRNGFIMVKITSYGKHVSLNPKMMKQINELIQKYYTEVVFK